MKCNTCKYRESRLAINALRYDNGMKADFCCAVSGDRKDRVIVLMDKCPLDISSEVKDA